MTFRRRVPGGAGASGSVWQTRPFLAVLSLWIAWALLLPAPLLPTRAEAAPEAASKTIEGLAASEVRTLIELLEDPERSKSLARQLRLLLEMQQATEAVTAVAGAQVGREQAVEKAEEALSLLPFVSYRRIAEGAKELAGRVGRSVSRFPEATADLFRGLREPRNFVALLVVVGKLVAAVAVGIAILITSRWFFRWLILYTRSEPGLSFGRKATVAATSFLCNLLPWVLLLLFYQILAEIWSLPRWVTAGGLTIFFALFLYKLVTHLADACLSPADENRRLLPVPGEGAEYSTIWVRRFSRYTVFFSTLLTILDRIPIPQGASSVLWGLFKIGLLALVAVLLVRWKDRIARLLQAAPDPTSPEYALKNRWVLFYNRMIGRSYMFLTVYIFVILTVSFLGYPSVVEHMIVSSVSTAIIIAVGVLIRKAFSALFRKLFAISQSLKDYYPDIEQQAHRHMSVARTILDIFLTVILLFFVLEAWGVDIYREVTTGALSVLIRRAILVGVTVLIAVLVVNFSDYFINRFLVSLKEAEGKGRQLSRRQQTLVPLMKNAVKYVTFFLAGVIILRHIGIDPTAIIAGAGVMGLAIGFGAQTLVKDIITGFFLMFEDSISVGDVVDIGGSVGLVEEVGIRVTKVRFFSGELRIIPNSEISQIGNYNRGWMRAIADVGVAYEGDVEKAMTVLKRVADQYAAEYPDLVLEAPEVQGVMNLGASSVDIRVAMKVKPLKQWEIERGLRLRIKKAFDEEGIEIPFNRQVTYIRADSPEIRQALAMPPSLVESSKADLSSNP